MTNGFWESLKRPIYALAPMANVTDVAFRRVIAKYGKPDVMWTEFVSCDGLLSEGRDRLLIDLAYSEIERPIVAQIFGSKPENFYKCAQLMNALGFDGIDINMGCPDRAVEKQGAGAALIQNPDLAKEIIYQTMLGARGLPVSVKTRLGYNTNTLEEWLGHLLGIGLTAITIHARTRKEMSVVPAHWDEVGKAVQIAKGSGTFILGNGDVGSLFEAETRAKETGADGIMMGRGIFGNPFCFNRSVNMEDLSLREHFEIMLEHTRLFEELLGEYKSFDTMKKHYKAYVSGWDGAKELRMKLMSAKNSVDVEGMVEQYLTESGIH